MQAPSRFPSTVSVSLRSGVAAGATVLALVVVASVALDQSPSATPELRGHTAYLFGYGSLIHPLSRSHTSTETGDAHPVRVMGLRRGWNCETDATTVVAVEFEPGHVTNGVLVEVTQEALEAFDLREKYYKRSLISHDDVEFLPSDRSGTFERVSLTDDDGTLLSNGAPPGNAHASKIKRTTERGESGADNSNIVVLSESDGGTNINGDHELLPTLNRDLPIYVYTLQPQFSRWRASPNKPISQTYVDIIVCGAMRISEQLPESIDFVGEFMNSTLFWAQPHDDRASPLRSSYLADHVTNFERLRVDQVLDKHSFLWRT